MFQPGGHAILANARNVVAAPFFITTDRKANARNVAAAPFASTTDRKADGSAKDRNFKKECYSLSTTDRKANARNVVTPDSAAQ